MALYLMSVYGQPALADWLHERYAAGGMKLDMGKICIRFKKLEQVPLEVIGEHRQGAGECLCCGM